MFSLPDWVWAALVLGALAALHARSTVVRTNQERVFLFGDSLAQGLTAPMKALAESRGAVFAADSQPGTTFPAWLSRGPQGAAAMNATVVFISLGTNDAGANPEHQAKVAGWAQLLAQRLRGDLPGVRVYFLAPPDPMPFPLDTVMNALRQSGAAVLVEKTALPRYDRIHPTPAAFTQWATNIWNAVL